jgi:hypothetical protein
MLLLLLTGYRPDWEGRLAKTCSQNMSDLEVALDKFAASGGTVKGTGEPASVYPLREKAFLTVEWPVCPVERERKPAPLPYLVHRTPTGSLVVRCAVHGSREQIILIPKDPDLCRLVDLAKEARGRRNLYGSILMVILIWGSPVILFLGGILIFGKSGMARVFPRLKMLYLIPNYVILLGWLPGSILAPVAPAQEILNLLAMIALITVVTVHLISPDIASWKKETPPDPPPPPLPTPPTGP